MAAKSSPATTTKPSIVREMFAWTDLLRSVRVFEGQTIFEIYQKYVDLNYHISIIPPALEKCLIGSSNWG